MSPDAERPVPDHPVAARHPLWVMPSHTVSEEDVDELWTAVRAAREVTEGRPFVLAVDGRSGSGKSGLAARLLDRAAAEPGIGTTETFRLDELYPGWEGLEAGVDQWAGMLEELLAGRDATWRPWDWTRDRPAEILRTVSADADLLVVEGVGASAPGAAARPHFCVWLHLEEMLRRRRALARDGELYRPWWTVWAAQEERLFSR